MDVLIYGAGLLGKQVHYVTSTYFKDRCAVLGFVDDEPAKKDAPVVGGLKVLGALAEVAERNEYASEDVTLILAIGYANMQARKRAFLRARGIGYHFERVIHPSAHIEPDVSLGEGVVVLAGAIIDQHTTIGDVTFVDMGTAVCEDCHIGENNFISAGTTIGGQVTIGESNFIGLDTTIVNGITIGNNNQINAKTLIHKNLEDNTRVVEFHEQRVLQGS